MHQSLFLISFHLFKNVLFSFEQVLEKDVCHSAFSVSSASNISWFFKLNRKAYSHSILIALLNVSEWCFAGAF